ncbi:MAG: SMP-30/gluconolactonase/LRE family protein [Bryobacteraceae bacterium]|nr:SMP-30/gluconolactonase/LRE family protein [Bryobacteraceae bacterium]
MKKLVLLLSLAAQADVRTQVVDLLTIDGSRILKAEWRVREANLLETSYRQAGVDGQPGAQPSRTFDIAPHAGAVDFDDSAWERAAPGDLSRRRGGGRLSFVWYRLRLTVPELAAGKNLVFETSIDDYAEIWIDGELARAEGSLITGWNTGNRVLIGRGVKPGQQITLAIFGGNGPLSNPPTNYVWMRHARVAIEPGSGGPVAVTPHEVNVEVERRDPAIDQIVPLNAKVYKLAEGFQFTEGPVWVDDHLLFSDPNANTIYQYSDREGLSVFRRPSGYEGADIAEYRQPGSNGLTLDPQGRLTVNEHGNRRVTRTEKDGRLTVLADRFEGKRLNSPNDLVYRSDGTLFFTDPAFGLPKFAADPRKELAFTGVYALRNGRLTLLTKDFTGPNGISLSPDEKFLYVGNWDDKRKVVYRFPLKPDASVGEGELFFDMTEARGEDAIDGVKVDRAGNLYVSGPGGLWILSPEGKHLGTIKLPRHPHNMAWGDDGKTLYLCARDRLYRMPLKIEGVRPGAASR